jgi:hypothetical protein
LVSVIAEAIQEHRKLPPVKLDIKLVENIAHGHLPEFPGLSLLVVLETDRYRIINIDKAR